MKPRVAFICEILVGKPIDEFREVRSIIEEKVKNLVNRIKMGELK